MAALTLEDPLFATYAIAASLMSLKAVSMSWLTVARMMQVRGGFRSPEDLRKTVLNPSPNPQQLLPDERVERLRRIQMNDLENLPFFLVAGLLFILTEPPLTLARWLLFGYVVSRFLHFAAYATARTHDTRATLWSIGSLIVIFMICWTLWLALDAALIRTAGIALIESADVGLQEGH
jgi:glutathione S-transferase